MKDEIIVSDFGAPAKMSEMLAHVSEEETWLADLDSARSIQTGIIQNEILRFASLLISPTIRSRAFP